MCHTVFHLGVYESGVVGEISSQSGGPGRPCQRSSSKHGLVSHDSLDCLEHAVWWSIVLGTAAVKPDGRTTPSSCLFEEREPFQDPDMHGCFWLSDSQGDHTLGFRAVDGPTSQKCVRHRPPDMRKDEARKQECLDNTSGCH